MERLRARCSAFGLPLPSVAIEPGRWIVGEAGITLYTIGAIKEIAGSTTYISVDGGMADNPRPALYGLNMTPKWWARKACQRTES